VFIGTRTARHVIQPSRDSVSGYVSRQKRADGGFGAWKKAGGPVEAAKQKA
jgi:hypothetical protein